MPVHKRDRSPRVRWNPVARLLYLSPLVLFVGACTSWSEYHVRALPADTAIAPLRVILRDGTQLSLTNVLVTPDSVVGIGSATVVRVAYPRSDVRNMLRRSLQDNAEVRVTRQDGSQVLVRNVKVTQDSVTGTIDGPPERVAIARADVRQLQRHHFNAGRSLLIVAVIAVGVMLSAVSTMGSYSLGGTP